MAPSRLKEYIILEAAVMLSRPQNQQAPSGMPSSQMLLVPAPDPYLPTKESQKICRTQHLAAEEIDKLSRCLNRSQHISCALGPQAGALLSHCQGSGRNCSPAECAAASSGKEQSDVHIDKGKSWLTPMQ